jgi:hypothetical protein
MSRTMRITLREIRSATRSPTQYVSRFIQVRYPRQLKPPASAKKRVFSLDLHAAGTASVRGGLDELGIELVQWMIGDPKHVARDRPTFPVADPVAHVNRHSWTDLSEERIAAFWRRYGRFLDQFDGFLVNHASAFARLFLPSGKPVLVHNTSRYENPYTMQARSWEALDEDLIKGVEAGQLLVASNNRADADYLRFYTGIQSSLMPSVTDYVSGIWTMERPVMALNTLSPQVEHAVSMRLGSLLKPLGTLFPLGYTHNELFGLSGVVVVPYQVSTMFMFEVMNARMPLYVPSDELLQDWFNREYLGVLSQLSYLQVHGVDTEIRPIGDLNRICDAEVRQWWLDRADFGQELGYPLMHRFDSLDHLAALLEAPQDLDSRELATSWVVQNRDRRRKILSDFVSLM